MSEALLTAVIVDDEPLLLGGLRRLISWEAFGIGRVETYEDPVVCAAALEAMRVDILLCDVRMPGMNGLGLVRRVKQQQPDCLFVLFTAFPRFEYARDALRLGVIDFIEKPVTVEKVTSALERARTMIEPRESKHPMRSVASRAPNESPSSAVSVSSYFWRAIVIRARDPEPESSIMVSDIAEAIVASFPETPIDLVSAAGAREVCLAIRDSAQAEVLARLRERVPAMINKAKAYEIQAAIGVLVPARSLIHLSERSARVASEEQEGSFIVAAEPASARIDVECALPDEEQNAHAAVIAAKDYIDSRFAEPITREVLADEVGLNPSYFSTLFHDVLGIRYVDYLRLVRLSRAQALLRRGMKVAKAAEAVGYQNARRFAEVFKEQYEVTPAEYRRRWTS